MSVNSSTKKMYLAEFLVVSKYKLPNRWPTIKDSEKDFEIHINNYLEHWEEIRKDKPFIRCIVILKAEDFQDAQIKSRQYLSNVIDFWSLLNNQYSYIMRLVRVVDWTPGLQKREYRAEIPLRVFGRSSSLIKNEALNEKMWNDIEKAFNYSDIAIKGETNTEKELRLKKRKMFLLLLSIFNAITLLEKEDVITMNLQRAFELFASIREKGNEKKQFFIGTISGYFSESDSINIWNFMNSIKHGSTERIFNIELKNKETISNHSELNEILQLILREKILYMVNLKIPAIPDLRRAGENVFHFSGEYNSDIFKNIENPIIENLPELKLPDTFSPEPGVVLPIGQYNINLLYLTSKY